MNHFKQTVFALTAMFILSTWLSPVSFAQENTEEEAPPAVKPELLFAGYVGREGNQAFEKVKVTANSVMAQGKGLGLIVYLNPDGSFRKASVRGNPASKLHQVPKSKETPSSARVPGHPVKYGFRQVHSILQQPYVHIGRLKLYDWTYEQAKGAKARYAPYMSDSRINFVMPTNVRGEYLIVGSSDGGNSCFQATATDINKGSRMNKNLNTGGGGGKSSWLFVYNHKGEEVHPGFAVRGHAAGGIYDKWGRLIIWGKGIRNPGKTANKFEIISDGGGIMMVDTQFQRRLFLSSMGSDILHVDYDEKTGIFAAVGYYQGSPTKNKKGKVSEPKTFNQTNGVQDKPGGGTDAFLVVWRMWEPRYTERDLEKIEKWKADQAEKKE